MLYDWLQIARKPAQNLREDLKMVMDLIQIPVTPEEVDFLIKIIDPHHQKERLLEEDFLSCFIVPEEAKKPKEKELIAAFKYHSENAETISFEKLQSMLKEEGLEESAAEMVLKQMTEWEKEEGEFDFKKFASAGIWFYASN